MLRLLLPLLFLCAATARADEWWGWTMLEFHRTEASNTGLFMGNRLDADDGAYVQIISPRHKQRVLPWLELGAGLSLLGIKNLKEDERFLQFRPELEVNPRLDLSPSLRLDIRNRMEWRWNEREDITVHRSRHRLQLGWELPEPAGPLTRFFINNEWLSDLHRGQWWENRAVPLGMTFHCSKSAELDLFYMIFSTRQQAHWRHESVLGTYLRLRF